MEVRSLLALVVAAWSVDATTDLVSQSLDKAVYLYNPAWDVYLAMSGTNVYCSTTPIEMAQWRPSVSTSSYGGYFVTGASYWGNTYDYKLEVRGTDVGLSADDGSYQSFDFQYDSGNQAYYLYNLKFLTNIQAQGNGVDALVSTNQASWERFEVVQIDEDSSYGYSLQNIGSACSNNHMSGQNSVQDTVGLCADKCGSTSGCTYFAHRPHDGICAMYSGSSCSTSTHTGYNAYVMATTDSPTKSPTKSPTDSPTKSPTKSPTDSPTKSPTKSPTDSPTKSPTTAEEFAAEQLQASLDNHEWQTAQNGDIVYKCSDISGCFSNSPDARGAWSRTEYSGCGDLYASTDIGCGSNTVLSTSDGVFTVDPDNGTTFVSGGLGYTNPWSCGCGNEVPTAAPTYDQSLF